MQELVLNKPEDLEKLAGWTIEGVSMILGPEPVLAFQMRHPAHEWPIKLSIVGGVNFGRAGNVMICNATFTLRTEDVR